MSIANVVYGEIDCYGTPHGFSSVARILPYGWLFTGQPVSVGNRVGIVVHIFSKIYVGAHGLSCRRVEIKLSGS